MIPRTTQPMTDSVIERPMSLIEKLEREVKRLLELKAQEKPHSLGYVFLGHHIAATVNAINIAKRHSDWVGVNERLPPNVTDEEKNYILLIHKEWGGFIIGQYIKENDEINSYMGNDPISDFAYWMPIPQPPSEVQA